MAPFVILIFADMGLLYHGQLLVWSLLIVVVVNGKDKQLEKGLAILEESLAEMA